MQNYHTLSDIELVKEIKKLKSSRVGFDVLTASLYIKLKSTLNNIELVPRDNLVWKLRRLKDETEINNMRKAAQLTDEGAKVASEKIRAGIREYELAAEIEYAMRKLGSEGVAFDTIVASGVRSAYPHGG